MLCGQGRRSDTWAHEVWCFLLASWVCVGVDLHTLSQPNGRPRQFRWLFVIAVNAGIRRIAPGVWRDRIAQSRVGCRLRGESVTDQNLQVDLDALGRLKPQIDELVGEVTQGLPGHIPAGGVVDGGAVPSLAAAQEMSTRTLAVVKAAVGSRFSKVGEMIDYARSGFLTADGQLLDVVNTVPTLQRPSK